MIRDLTQKQYADALRRHGLTSVGLLRYVCMPDGVKVSALSGGRTRRAQLAYLLRQKDLHPYEKHVERVHITACIRALTAGRPFSAIAAKPVGDL